MSRLNKQHFMSPTTANLRAISLAQTDYYFVFSQALFLKNNLHSFSQDRVKLQQK